VQPKEVSRKPQPSCVVPLRKGMGRSGSNRIALNTGYTKSRRDRGYQGRKGAEGSQARVRLYSRPGNDVTGRFPWLLRRWGPAPLSILHHFGGHFALSQVDVVEHQWEEVVVHDFCY
jgi:hypothetical protein